MGQLAVINPPSIPAMTISDVARVAEAIAKGGLFGSTNPSAVLTLCLLAQAEGQHPAVVFRDYHIISGKPAKKADAMLRDFINAGGKVEWHSLDDKCADATFTHPSGCARIDWTMERAKKAGLTTAMWNKYPRQMLRSRVISEGVRTVYPGATSGLYEENEVRDIVADTPTIDGGDITGHSQEGALGPDDSAGYAFPEGPATGITQLKAMQKALWREIEGCGDAGELEPLLAIPDNKAIMRQLSHLEKPDHRTLWYGDDGDNPGLQGLIRNKRKLFDMQAISGGAYQEEPA